MKISDFKIGWRILLNEPAYSALNIFFLAIGYAACFLLAGYVQYSFSYDANIPDGKNVYLVKSKKNLFSPPHWSINVSPSLSAVAKNSGLTTGQSTVTSIDAVFRVEDKIQKLPLIAVESDFPALFGIQSVDGDLASSLSRPDTVALTVRTAQKLFGNTSALHKTVSVNGKLLEVLAILPTPPSNTTQPYEALIGLSSVVLSEQYRDRNNWNSSYDGLYLKLRPDASRAELKKILQDAQDKFGFGANMRINLAQLGLKSAEEIDLESIADSYFDDGLEQSTGAGDRANKKIVVGLGFVALLVLLLAATNYVNLVIARTLKRQREIGIRKALGANAKHIISQFMVESMLVSMLATIVGIVLAWLLLPLFSELMARSLDSVLSFQNIGYAILFGLFIGALTGAYPAWISIRVRATESLAGRGNHETTRGMWLRRILTVLQFSIAMGFTGLTLAIYWQTQFASNLDPGFDTDHLQIIDMPVDMTDPTGVAFKNKVAHLAGIAGVALSSSPPGGSTNRTTSIYKTTSGKSVIATLQSISANYFDIYHIKPRAGRFFSPTDDATGNTNVTVINASAALALGFSSPEAAVGQPFPAVASSSTIIGIAPDIRFHSLRETDAPTEYALRNFTSVLTVRVNGDPALVDREIKSAWAQCFPADTMTMRSAKTALGENYADDLRLGKLLAGSSILAIVISAFGIYVLSAYSVQRRTREIVLRKLYGASGAAIARLLAREFGLLLAISALIGLPVAATGSARYLSDFVQHAPMGIWPLIVALLVACVVAFVAVLRQSWVAIHLPPMKAFR